MVKYTYLAFPLGLGLLGGCGGNAEPVQQPDPTPSATAARPSGPKLNVSSELGTIDDKATQKTFEKLGAPFDVCRKQAQKRLSFVAGDVKFFVRVGQDGHVKYTYFEQSNLGDAAAEKCLLDAVTAQQWPIPDGGEAEVRYQGYGFDLDQNVRGAFDWPSDKIAAALGKHKDELDKCVDGAGAAKFTVTAYVEPSGKEGKVVAAGVSTTAKEGAAKIECIVLAVKAIKMPSPGSYAAKVTFGL
ncbi:hypothetical protein BH09MYX1_BH09MYX1_06580 [soil metagenome]